MDLLQLLGFLIMGIHEGDAFEAILLCDFFADLCRITLFKARCKPHMQIQKVSLRVI